MSKFKVIIKALFVKLEKFQSRSKPSLTTRLTVTGFLDPDHMTTSMVNLVGLEATWTIDNVIVKATRNLDHKAEVIIKIEMENGKPINTLALDILPYVTQVEPGSKKRFEIKQSVTDKGSRTIVIGLSLAISRDIDRKTPKITPRNLRLNSKMNSESALSSPRSKMSDPVSKMYSESSRLISPRKLEIDSKVQKYSSTEPNSPKDGKSTDTVPQVPKLIVKSLETLPMDSYNILDQDQPNNLEKKVSHSGAKRLRTNSFLCRTVASRNIPRPGRSNDSPKNNQENSEESLQASSTSLMPTTMSTPLMTSITGPSSPSGLTPSVSATLPRLVERAKVPATSTSYQPRTMIRRSRTQPRQRTNGEDPPVPPSLSSTMNDINISLLKEEYKSRAAEAAERYLVEDLIKAPVPGDRHVVAFIIWRSLIQWDAFILDDGLHLRIATQCERAVKEYAGSLNMLSHWLATSLCLLHMTLKELKKDHKEEEENRLMEYHQCMQSVATVAFESILTLFQSRLGPVMQVVMDEVLSATSPAIGDDMPPRLNDLLEQVRSYIECMQQRWVLEEVKLQFLLRVIHFFCAFILDNLTHHSSTYAQGLQLKLMIPKLEEWVIDLLGPQVVLQLRAELEPIRQIANVLCLPQKTDLATTSIRNAVCPLLHPTHVANLLATYRPDQFISETVPETVIQELLDQDPYDEKLPVPGLFNPQFGKLLDFSFKGEVFDLEDVAIPKVVLDQQAFAFLKPQKNGSGNGFTKEKWM